MLVNARHSQPVVNTKVRHAHGLVKHEKPCNGLNSSMTWFQVGVAGMGGLGHLALQFAKAVGAEVYAMSGSKSKEEEARTLGAAHFMSKDEVPDSSLDVILVTAPG